MRLIDADALKVVLDGIVKTYIKDRSFQCNFAAGVVCDIRDEVVDKMPTIEAELVKHGEWLLRHVGHGHYWECSACHTNPCIYVTKDTNCCPNCGAKMDLEETK